MDGLIPTDLAASIVRQTGAAITAIVPRGGGGASRQGAELTLRYPDGREQRGYLSYDTRAGDASRLPFFRREVAILAALSGPLAGQGVLAPRFIAAEQAHLALLCELTPGHDRFAAAGDGAALAADFMAQLAALHRIDPASVALDGFGSPSASPSDRIRARIAALKAETLANMPDPILILALLWLGENIPADRGPSVIVHGDAGAGNFLHADNKVTALLDWELTHFGDPMEDLAQIWVRSLFQPFVPMRDVFAAYEAAGGVAVDVDAVRFHRLYFQMSFMVHSHASQHRADGAKVAMLGVSMMFGTAHRRVVVHSLAELTGQILAPYELPDAPPSDADGSYATALDDLQDSIVPRLSDQHAATKAKSLARLVKYWRARDRFGAVFEQAELDEVHDLLGVSFADVTAARVALARAIVSGSVPKDKALQICLNRVTRETALMADGMGSLRDCYFPPLDGAA